MRADLERYACQVALPGFGAAGQQLLQQAKIFIAGAGGLGCPVAQYLAAAGVGTVAIADYDTISTSNLHRQTLYTPAETGMKKAEVLCGKLRQQNPEIVLIAIDVKITSDNVLALIDGYDIIVDCTDNFETKYLLNDTCVLSGKPLVYGAIYQYEGQVAVWNVLNEDGSRSPNYRDLFPEVDASQVPNCADGGVIPTLAGIIGCMQANEVIKYIVKTGTLLQGKLLVFDALTMQSRIIKLGEASKTNITSLVQTTASRTTAWSALKASADGQYELVDVRTNEEHELGNIGGRNIPLSELEKGVSLLDSGKTIVFYCATGKRSEEAVKMMIRHNEKTTALSLQGGLNALPQDG